MNKKVAFGWMVVIAASLGVACSGKKHDIARVPSTPPETERTAESRPSGASGPSRAEAAPVMESPEEAWFRTATLQELQKKLQDVFFEYDQDELLPEARSALQQNFEWLTAPYNDLVLEVEGHCDERGTAEYNLSLGHRRSGAAADYLVSLGLPANRLRTVSYGKERPQCTDPRESCWWRNRRAHFKIVSRDGRRLSD